MNKLFLISTIIILVCILFLVYKKSKNFKNVEKNKNKNKTIGRENYNSITVILCHANWCSHCPEVKKWYMDLINNSPLPNITFISYEEQEIPSEINSYIIGFPTILINNNGNITKYDGDRTKKSLLAYLKNL